MKDFPNWVTEEAIHTLRNGYLQEGENFYDAIKRISTSASKYLEIEGMDVNFCKLFQKDLYDILKRGYLGCASPVFTNLGVDGRGLPISCFSVSVDDSISGIFNSLAETAKMTQKSGGVGVYMGNIRPSGSPILSGGTSTGVLPFAKLFDSTAKTVAQGCYSEDTEVLTEKGFKLFSDVDIKHDKIAQFNPDNQSIEFVLATEYFEYDSPDSMIRVYTKKSNYVDLLVTPNHKMVVQKDNKNKSIEFIEASNVKYYRGNYHFLTGNFINNKDGVKNNLSNYERILIAYQADGSTKPSWRENVFNRKTNEVPYRFHFSKTRKIDRLIELLNGTNLIYTISRLSNSTYIKVKFEEELDKEFSWVELSNVTKNWCQEFIEEISFWDGSVVSKNSINYFNTNKKAVLTVQEIATLAGYRTSIKTIKPKESHKLIKYKLQINKCDYSYKIGGDSLIKEKVSDYSGKVYCLEVPSHCLVVRRNNCISICGNSMRRGSFALYLPIEHPDIKELLLAKDHTQGDSRRWIDSNIAITISDDFIKSMLSGDREKRELFSNVITTRLKCGSPYILFIDNVNNANPISYKKNNLKVETSNLCCLAYDTKVSTVEYGNVKIGDIVEKYDSIATIFDGERWVKVKFKKYKKSFLYRIKLKNGSYIDMTWNHRNLLQNKEKPVFAKDLRIGDKLQYSKNVLIRNEQDKDDYTIVDILRVDGAQESYCCNVPTTSYFELSNGVLTGNSEITLYTDKEHSFICCLSSLNLDKYDEWRNYTTPNLGLSVPFISIIFLDAVLSEFIEKAKDIPELHKAVRSAKKGRALGLGVQGLASLYQRRMLPFSSKEAFSLNIEVHKYINQESILATNFLAEMLGEPEWCKGTKTRNSHCLSIAPTRTNSVICNSISQGIEPIDKNYFVAKQDKGVYVRKNPHLEKLLREKYNRDDIPTWDLIAKDNGSVRNLDFLSDYEKEVFATAREIDQKDLVRQAADRQKYICQAQSLNLFIDNRASEQYLVELHLLAWKLGVKSLYYLRSTSKQQMKTLNYLITKDNCPWCKKLKEELDIRKIEYEEIPISEAKKRGIWKNSYKTVPQLFLGNEHIGGYEDYMSKYVYGVSGSPLPNTVDGEIPFLECINCEG